MKLRFLAFTLVLTPSPLLAQPAQVGQPIDNPRAAFAAEWGDGKNKLPMVQISSQRALGADFVILNVLRGPGPGIISVTRSVSEFRRGGANVNDQMLRRDWTSTADCPALRARLESLEKIDVPRPVLAGLTTPDNVWPKGLGTDGIRYVLEARTAAFPSTDYYGTVHVEANMGSPLEAWMQETTTALAACWKPGRP